MMASHKYSSIKIQLNSLLTIQISTKITQSLIINNSISKKNHQRSNMTTVSNKTSMTTASSSMIIISSINNSLSYRNKFTFHLQYKKLFHHQHKKLFHLLRNQTQTMMKMTSHINLLNRRPLNYWCHNRRRHSSQQQKEQQRKRASLMIQMTINQTMTMKMITSHQLNNKLSHKK